ncbi:MAG: chromosome segregation SMC family protein, partial [Planctomycetaceae bacterium]
MLKSLELMGFKSFADRTRFDFAPGITCVVGPNGSGKSNVVDAIKWILGDQSPKSLRGREMTDVIFNGSGARKAAGFAEALLTFDNSQRPLAVDADEVQVGRRIYRSGEAEYLLNRVPARLKDVRDLFLGTGAGTSAYSIIEQGRVDQLLQASALNRRAVFEEAAGISRYKARKVEAQRKLERVAQNLLRLTDIVKEVETQLQTLRTQATRAARYREHSQELRTLRIGAAADAWRDLSATLGHLETEHAALHEQVTELADQSRDCESQQQAAESRLAEAEDRLHAAERLEAENREVIAGYEATVRHQSARQHELQAECARLKQQQDDLALRARQVAGELHQTEGDIQKFIDGFDRRRAQLSERELAVNELAESVGAARARLEQLRAELLESVRPLSAAQSRLATLASQVALRETACAQARGRLAELAAPLAAAQALLAEKRSALEVALAEQAALRELAQSVAARRAALHARQAESQANLAELREQRGAVQARRLLLEEMEARQEGLGMGVREILALAREAAGPPWSHVRGHVVELVEVEMEHAALLEVALGSRAQLVVLDDLDPLLAFLNSGHCRISGRVGFLALRQASDFSPSPGGHWYLHNSKNALALPSHLAGEGLGLGGRVAARRAS